MNNVTITLNDNQVQAEQDITILEAATANGVTIPTLCFLKGLTPHASCRMCVVEVEGSRALVPACITNVADGMAIRTETPEVRESRKNTLELLMARHSVDCHHCLRSGMSTAMDLDTSFCEMCFFCDCVRDGNCELQTLCREYGVDLLPYTMEPDLYLVDTSTGCVVHNPNKCIKCRRCVDVCSDVQTVHALSLVRRGSDIRVMPAMGKPLSETSCVKCGRCAQVCPTGAMHILERKDELLYHTHSYDIATIAQISDDVLDELAVLSGMKRWQLTVGHVAAGLKKIGVDYVVTETVALSRGQQMAADFLKEAANNLKQPVVITSSAAASRFVFRYFPKLSRNLFRYDSACQQFGKTAGNGWPTDIEPALPHKKICTISISGNPEKQSGVEFVLNPRELYRIFQRTGVNLNKIHRIDPDSFGNPVELEPDMAKLLSHETWDINSTIDEQEVNVAGITLKAAVGKTLGHARQLLKQATEGNSPYQIIKITS